MGLAGVVATQLWHHLYMGGGLADLPTWEAYNHPPFARSRPAAA